MPCGLYGVGIGGEAMSALKKHEDNLVPFKKKEVQMISKKFDYVNSIRDVEMHSTTKLVAITLATYANYETGVCYPTVQTLMRNTGLSNRVVSHHIQQLETLGFLLVKRSKGCNSKYKFVAENIEKEVTESHHSESDSSDFNDTKAVTLMQEVVTLNAQSSDAESHKPLLTFINYKENIHTQENPPQKTQDESWKPNLDLLTSILRTTKHSQRVSEILGMVDFKFHLGNFNAHWEDKITLTENQRTRKFVSWITQEFEKSQRVSKAKPVTPSRNVNDQWGEVQHYAPASDIDCEGMI